MMLAAGECVATQIIVLRFSGVRIRFLTVCDRLGNRFVVSLSKRSQSRAPDTANRDPVQEASANSQLRVEARSQIPRQFR